MVINTWNNFQKDKNSTKQPTNGNSYNMTLKEDTSLINPTFIFNYNGVPTFNYCQYNLMYYFVDDIIQRNKNIYEIKCSLDALATYKSDIIASSQFVVRSESDYNVNLADSEMLPALNQTLNYYGTIPDILSGSSFIVRVLSKKGTQSVASVFGVPTYVMNKDQIQEFIKACFDDTLYPSQVNSLDDVGKLFKCALYNPSENILSINWIPNNITGGSAERVYVGNLNTKIDAQSLGAEGTYSAFTLTRPTRHFNDFRDFDNRFTQCMLQIPAVGIVPINPSDVYDGISCTINLEFLTGNISYIFYTSNNSVVGKYTANVNASIAIGGDTGQSFANSLSSAVSALGTLGLSSPSANFGGTSNALGSIGKITQNIFQPSFTCIGNNTGMMDIKQDHTIRIMRRVFGSSGYGTSRTGRPLNEIRTLSNLSGYCQCQNAKLDTNAFGEVKDSIINYMNSGFFIE